MTMNARDKIKTISELAQTVRQLQSEGKKVVLAHGVYDLVHLGHVRHLEQARSEGDILIVTTTADKYVNKGPGRPIFTEQLRAEMLAALGYVDWVGINYAPDASNILESLRPDVYVKGSDYENPDEDITGKIREERNTVEKHGGRIVFTKDITFSSSSLINQYMDVLDPQLREYLAEARARGIEEQILDALVKASELRVLVVGDAIIDEYHYVNTMGKSAKEHMIATRYESSERFAGGVFAAANHIASFCKEVEILTMLGSDDSQEDFIRAHLAENVRLTPIMRENTPTTRKSRFIDAGYIRKLFEVYYFDDSPPPHHVREEICNTIAERADDFDLVVVTDFGHGMLDDDAIDALGKQARFLAVNTQTNSANHGYNMITRYPRANFICVDTPEAQLAANDKFSSVEEIVVNKLMKQIDCESFVVTHGKHGCIMFSKDGNFMRIPAFTKTVVDTVGAGDAFFAVGAPLAALGAPLEVVSFVGNAAGAMKVGIVGHRRWIEKVPLIKYVTTLLK